MSKKKFYLTTPIYYVNARPHIGHAYTTIAADVIARRHRLLGDDTFFLTGTDEHGQKIERAALAAGIPPQEYADQVSASFRALWDRMGITFDNYIRTTEPRHSQGVQKLFQLLCDRGYIELSTYTGQYSVGEEMFVDGPPGTIGPDGKPTETVTEENYFFKLSIFQLALIDRIESGELSIQPEVRRNEVLSFLRGNASGVAESKRSKLGNAYVEGALKDLSISRTSFKWGIPVPGNEKHVIYVWLDALANYMTAVGYGSDDLQEKEKFERYWPADLHLVGKEIIRFHCVYWPAFLLAAGLALPKAITAHGWLLFEESKMSKSRGNIVRTETILDAFGTLKPKPVDGPGAELSDEYWKHEQDLFASDVLRYFLLREIPFGQDGSFSFDALITRYNADLANGYGNLVSRTLTMINKYFDGQIPFGNMAEPVALAIAINVSAVTNNYAELDFSSLLHNIMNIVRAADSHITATAPWKIAADQTRTEELKDVLYTAVESIRIVTSLIEPILPYTSTQVLAQLGIPADRERGSEPKWVAEKLGELSTLFPRADKGLIQIMTDMETRNDKPAAPEPSKLVDEKTTHTSPVPTDPAHPGAPPRTSAIEVPNPGALVGGSHSISTERPATPSHTEAPASGAFATSAAGSAIPDTPQVAIDDFVKIDLRVARIIVAERIPKADKLLRLEVDLGYEKRQILSGIAEWYTPEELIGRKIVVIANLAPRKMRGLESHGMLLAASNGEDGRPVLATFGEEITLGSRLK